MTTWNIKTDFSAVGDGSTDDTQAFKDAANTSNTAYGDTIIIPRGTYMVDPASLATAGTNFAGRRWVGERFSPDTQYTVQTIIKANGSGTSGKPMFWMEGAGRVSFIKFDGAGYVDYGAQGKHWAIWDMCEFTGANVAGFYADGGSVSLKHCISQFNNGAGIRLDGANGASLFDCTINDNDKEGLEVRGWLSTGSGVTESGGFMMSHCVIEQNNRDDNYHSEVLLDGIQGCVIDACWFELGSGTNKGRCVHIKNSAHGIRLRDNRFITGSSDTCVYTEKGWDNLCDGCFFVSGAYLSEVNGDNIGPHAMRVDNCTTISHLTGGPAKLKVTKTGQSDYTFYHSNTRGYYASTTPASAMGTWENGFVLMKDSPSGGSSPGWIYTGSANGWKAMAALAS